MMEEFLYFVFTGAVKGMKHENTILPFQTTSEAGQLKTS